MTSRIFAMMVALAGSLVACSSSDGSGGAGGGNGGNGGGEGGSGAAGGEGGSGGNTGTASTTGTGTTGTTSGTTTTSSSTTAQMTCDDLGVCADMDMNTSNDCRSCAIEGPCFEALQACGMSAECCNAQPDGSCGDDSFYGCIGQCGENDQVCVMDCETQYPQGAQLYSALVVCIFCESCLKSCDGASLGCL